MPAVINRDQCNACETCLDTCPNDAIELIEGKAKVLDELCIDCGLCEEDCPEEAISAD